MDDLTTITVPRRIHSKLVKRKIHRREPLYEVIERLMGERKEEDDFRAENARGARGGDLNG